MTSRGETNPVALDWRGLLALGAIAQTFSAEEIARLARIDVPTARRALDMGFESGIIVDGQVSESDAIDLIAGLPIDWVRIIHERIAIDLTKQGPSRLLDAMTHARIAGSFSTLDDIARMADHAARTSLSYGNYEDAVRLLQASDEIGFTDPPAERARRLRDLAQAKDGLGLVPEARELLARAFELADFAGDTSLVADIAIRYGSPADWFAGNLMASALLRRAEELELTAEDRVGVLAARSVVEMRVPTHLEEDQQVAWVTRSSIAQPLADQALAESSSCTPPTRLRALIAWRSTHRTPRELTSRREISAEALDLAQHLRLPNHQVDAAVMLAVDSLESGDRQLFEQASAVLRWIAEQDGNPRLGWHAHTVAAGIAHLDGDLDAAGWHRSRARELGQSIGFPGWLGADLFMLAQEVFTDCDLDEIRKYTPDDDGFQLSHPVGKLVVAQSRALLGNYESAEKHLRRAMLQLDEESSYLLCLTRSAEVASLIDVPDVVVQLIDLLTPWESHFAVDSNAWWCDGPVSLALAKLRFTQNDLLATRSHLEAAENAANSLGDNRSLTRIEALRARLPDLEPDHVPTSTRTDLEFSEREITVLRRLAAGQSNPEIARALAFSTSTIRNDVASIYRKLGVRTRAEAGARAAVLGLD